MQHSCALRVGGSVVCWGGNDDGQLGVSGGTHVLPTAVPGLSGVTQIAAGDSFTCAIDGDKHLWCWGSNSAGQLGIGTTDTAPHLPQKVKGVAGAALLENVTAIGGGADHMCAVASNKVVCWGANDHAQLGHDGTSAADQTPTVVPALANAIELIGHTAYTCAVNTGAATSAPQAIPLRIGAENPDPIAFGGNGHVCARDEADALWCWGEDDFGQLGGAVAAGSNYAALQQMTALGKVRTGAAGDDYSCVVTPDGQTQCIGVNDTSQLGNGTRDTSQSPHTSFSRVTGLPLVERVAAHGAHTCAILAHPCAGTGGAVMCWGANDTAQAGNGTSDPSSVPTPVHAP